MLSKIARIGAASFFANQGEKDTAKSQTAVNIANGFALQKQLAAYSLLARKPLNVTLIVGELYASSQNYDIFAPSIFCPLK